MKYQFSIFIAVSCLAHASLLLVPDRSPLVPLRIGGHAESLRITLLHSAPPTPTAAGAAVVHTVRPPTPPRHPPQHATARKKTVPDFVTAPVPRSAPTAATADVTRRTAATAAARTAAAQPSSPGLSDRVSAALQNQLAERFEYPWLARKRGWQGLVTLSLHIDKHGAVSQWRIARTSGHTVLDRSALEAARAIDRLRQADGLLNGESLNLSIPVRYRLVDS
jgi:protein TonB